MKELGIYLKDPEEEQQNEENRRKENMLKLIQDQTLAEEMWSKVISIREIEEASESVVEMIYNGYQAKKRRG